LFGLLSRNACIFSCYKFELKDELYGKPNIKKALEDGTRQVALYAKKLDNRYGNLRLKKFEAAALGFERVCFKKVD
jgi:hypothetical protein